MNALLGLCAWKIFISMNIGIAWGRAKDGSKARRKKMTNFEKIINRLLNLTPKQFAITAEKWLESEADEND